MLVAGDIGTLIDLDILEEDANGVYGPTNLDPQQDTVIFVFRFFDKTVVTKTGTLASPSKAQYTTQSGDILDIPGRCEIQLHITTAAGWDGRSWPPFVVDVGEKLDG